eukprot:5082994-Alexandrium_andersonii.AAC.1
MAKTVKAGPRVSGLARRATPAWKVPANRASSLPGDLWKQWLEHLEEVAPAWVYVSILFTHLLCCRITEVLRLSGSDFDFKKQTVAVPPLKGQPAIQKPMLSIALDAFLFLKSEGKALLRLRRVRGGKVRVYQDTWTWSESLLFKAERSDSKLEVRNKDSLGKALRRARANFGPYVDGHKTTSHSGRHRMVNDLKQAGIHQEAG